MISAALASWSPCHAPTRLGRFARSAPMLACPASATQAALALLISAAVASTHSTGSPTSSPARTVPVMASGFTGRDLLVGRR